MAEGQQNTGLPLEHIDIEVNHRCNLRCRHCSARAVKGKNPNELSTEQIRQILSNAASIGLRKVGLTGGEPLIDIPKLRDVAQYCVECLGIPLHMHTSGTLVEERHCRPGGVLTLFEAVSITFLGGDAATHDAMTRTRGSFERSLRGARICAEAGLPLTCYFIPTHGSCAGFIPLVATLRAIGVGRIRAMALAPSGRARPIYRETAPGREELALFEEDLLLACQRAGVHVEAGYCTRLSMPRLGVLAGHAKCMSGINRVHINSRGDVFPCTAASGVRELRLGNIGPGGGRLAELWRESRLLHLIRGIHNGGLAACTSCSQDPKCRSGCTVNACGTMPEPTRRHCPLVTSHTRQKQRGAAQGVYVAGSDPRWAKAHAALVAKVKEEPYVPKEGDPATAAIRGDRRPLPAYAPYIGTHYFRTRPRVLCYAINQNLSRHARWTKQWTEAWASDPELAVDRLNRAAGAGHALPIKPYAEGFIPLMAALVLRRYGLTVRDLRSQAVDDLIAVTNFVKFSTASDASSSSIPTSWWRECGERYVKAELHILQPDVILAFGERTAREVGRVLQALPSLRPMPKVLRCRFPARIPSVRARPLSKAEAALWEQEIYPLARAIRQPGINDYHPSRISQYPGYFIDILRSWDEATTPSPR